MDREGDAFMFRRDEILGSEQALLVRDARHRTLLRQQLRDLARHEFHVFLQIVRLAVMIRGLRRM